MSPCDPYARPHQWLLGATYNLQGGGRVVLLRGDCLHSEALTRGPGVPHGSFTKLKPERNNLVCAKRRYRAVYWCRMLLSTEHP
jgi:hypothetical protein